MKLFLSHSSALDYWRKQTSHTRASDDTLPKTQIVSLPDAPPDLSLFKNLNQQTHFVPPIHILVKEHRYRQRSQVVKQHVYSSNTPAGCFVQVSSELQVSSPEFCFMQMAEQLSLIRLIELGFELCGTYSLPTGGSTSPDKGFYDRAPLTTTKKLHTFITTMPGTKGHKKAVRAAKYILNCSASPMETKLAMLLTLPHNLGGYGFKAPALNSRIAAERTAAKTAGKSFYSCDLFWQDHLLAVEYDSDTFHTGSQRIAEDSKRRNTLAAMGISVITVTWQQLYQTDEFEQVASVLALHMSKKLKPVSQSLTNKHKELRDQLLGSQYDGY